MLADSKKTALVTGSLGFIGSHLCDALLKKGYYVIGTDLVSASFEFFNRGVDFVPSDLTCPKSVRELVAYKDVDEVYHTASIFNYSLPQRVLDRVNLGGTQNFLEAIAEKKAWDDRLKAIVHWSSGSINGRKEDASPANENDPLCPTNAYERSKAEQEMFVRDLAKKLQLPVTYLRPGGVYGPRSRYGLYKIIDLTAKGLTRNYFGDPKAKQSMVHVADVVGAALHLANSPSAIGEAYNVADDALCASGELTKYLAKEFKKVFLPVRLPVAMLSFPTWLSEKVAKLTGGDPLLIRDLLDHLKSPFFVSNAKLKQSGYQFKYPDTKIGLEQTLAWYRSEGWF